MDELLSTKEKWSYGCGDLGSNISWNMVSSFLLLFYTNVAMLPVAAVGTLMLVSRVFDAFVDPAIGIVVDRTRTRFGKARPYLLFAPVPLSILLVMIFSSPPQSVRNKLIYAFVTLMLMGLVYSFVNIPYAALMALMTRSPHQKMQLSSLRTAGSAVGTTLVTALCIPLVTFVGFDKHGFAIAAAIFATVSMAAFLVTFFNTRERFIDHAMAEPVQISATLRSLLSNRTFLVTFIFSFLNLVRVGALVGSIAYFALDILKQPWMISVLLPVMSTSSIFAALIAPLLFRRLGVRKGNWLSLAVAFVLFALLPLVQGRLLPFLAIYTLACIAMGTCTTAIWAMSTYAIDYQQWRFGTRNDGLLVSSISLSTKVGMAAGISLVAYMLAWAHFDPVHPGPASLLAIRGAFYGGSLLFIAMLFICICFYDLDKLHPEIVRELNDRSIMDLDPRTLVQDASRGPK